MIPIKLELTNFLSYRETAVIDFEGIDLACISGLNGAGKSSILDGITWALFGNSRSKSDDDLVNRLAAVEGGEAQVQFHFVLEGVVYRIVRRKRPRKSAVVEFNLQTGPDKWKTLSEGKIRETQAAIEDVLRMDYDTFINASFLLQGKADEFTTKTPNRRKEILADLLGVSQWDQYQQVVTERRREVDGKLLLLDAQMAEYDRELEEEADRRAAVEDAIDRLTSVEERVADKEALLDQLRKTEAAVKQQQQMVKNLANNLAASRRTLEELLRTRQQRQEERDAYQRLLDHADEITSAHTKWLETDEAVKAWQVKADEHNRLLQARRPHELEIAQARSRLEEQVRELNAQAISAADAEVEREGVVATAAASSQRLKQIAEALRDLSRQEKALHEARSELQQLQSATQLLSQELQQLKREGGRVEAMVGEKPAVAANAAAAQERLSALQVDLDALSIQREAHANGLAERDNLNKEQKRLREEMSEFDGRKQQLLDDSSSECPLCGQPLTEIHRQNVLDELQTEGSKLGDRYRANSGRLEFLAAEVPKLESLLKDEPRLEKELRTQQERRARAEARLEEIEQAVAEWQEGGHQARIEALNDALAGQADSSSVEERIGKLEAAVQEKAALQEEQHSEQRRLAAAEARLSEIERLVTAWTDSGKDALAAATESLETDSFAAEDQAALATLDEQAELLAYDAAAHDSARQDLDALSDAQVRYQELKQAEAAVKPLNDTLADQDKQIASQQEIGADLEKQHENAEADLETIAAGGGDLPALEDEVFRLREEKEAANRRLGAAQQRLEVLGELRKRRKQLSAERAELTLRISRLKKLEEACGRKGIQGLLIEQAVPEIEERANELLDRLTGGEMRVTFDTQRQLKSRDELVETLDIHIIDNAGERPYANYSGGEQFRVNFAIRLALSQLLANRAGARLQTLVIDEGFGSQDPNGRQRLVDAINTIKDDFSRILVITHIEELRDAFPTRIEVEKNSAGSHISIS